MIKWKKEDKLSGFAKSVTKFEDSVKEFVGCKHAIACSSGTSALMVVLMAMKQEDEKLLYQTFNISVPTWTYIAPVNCADFLGNIKLFDCDKTLNINKCPEGITILTDVGGVPADYDNFKGIIIADAAESLGATYKGRKVGTLADITITSFHASKIITTGEGGMIFTESDILAKKCRDLINQGYEAGYSGGHNHSTKGFNFRLSGIQAELGIKEMKELPKRLKHRKEIYEVYFDKLKDVLEFQEIPEDRTSSHYSVTVFFKDEEQRDKVAKCMAENEIEVSYWKPVHLQYPYLQDGFPVADDLYKRHLRLPMNNELTLVEAMMVSDKILGVLK